MSYIDNLKWRYATKKFNSSKKISHENLEQLKEAIQLSVSAYGLQLYKVLIIENEALKEQLKWASYGQEQLTQASHVVVFCNYTSVEHSHVDDFINRTAKAQRVNLDSLMGYSSHIKGAISNMTATQSFNWTSRQTYLALGNLLNACAELKIDSCPMEGFEPEKYNDILGLTNKGLNAAVIATIGYRSKEDHAQNRPKVRKPLNELFEVL